jgi:hypothetical protein
MRGIRSIDFGSKVDSMDTLALGILALGVAIIILGTVLWLRKRHQPQEPSDPIIELEKLVNCRSCDSLIPEGARKCAFCGRWQVNPSEKATDSRLES